MRKSFHLKSEKAIYVIRIMIWLWLPLMSSCGYLSINPPPDAEIAFPEGNNASWLTSAANMLAGAGYGEGNNIQDRAQNIYYDLEAQFGLKQKGWTDAALSWWLASSNNEWPENPYKIVLVYGNKYPIKPWANPDGAYLIASKIRQNEFVAASISWPSDNGGSGSGGHVLNCWGDDLGPNIRRGESPAHLRVTDNFRGDGGIVQTYKYDAYLHPNHNGQNAGAGWYISYDENHPFIKNIITLSEVKRKTKLKNIMQYAASLHIQTNGQENLSGISYQFTDAIGLPVFSSQIRGNNRKNERIIEQPSIQIQTDTAFIQMKFNKIDTDKPQDLIINTKSAIANSDKIQIKRINYINRNDEMIRACPDIGLKISSPKVLRPEKKAGFCGGYIVGSMRIEIADTLANDSLTLALFSFISQYNFDENPEQHMITIDLPAGYFIEDLKFGHSYGWIEPDSLSKFKFWLDELPGTFKLKGDSLVINMNWKGKLPYPPGEDFTKRYPELSGH